MTKYVRPIWAAALTALFYGCGHLYAGRAARYFWPMLGLLVVYLVAGAFGALSSIVVFAPLLVVFLCFYFFAVVDAYELVRRGEPTTRWYSRWYVCAAWAVVALSYQVLNDYIRVQYLGYMTYVYPDPSGIMAPVVMYSDRLLVDTRAYRSQMPQRGDVVVVNDERQGLSFVRRIADVGAGDIQFKCDNPGMFGLCIDIGLHPISSVVGRVTYVFFSRDVSRIGRVVE